MKKTRRRALYILAALIGALFVLSCLVGFAACGGGEETPEENNPTENPSGDVATVSNVSVTPTTLELDLDDDDKTSGTVAATVTMSDGGSYTGTDYTWTSSKMDVATVSGSGATATVTAVAAGSASVIVTVGGKTATCAVTVTGGSDSEDTGSGSGDTGSGGGSAVTYNNTYSFEAEGAYLLNAVGSSGSTSLLETEDSSSFEGVTQVKNFNLVGDEIVFQLDASAAITGVAVEAYVMPTTDDFDASEHAGFIKVNGQAVTLTNTTAIAKNTYGALTATADFNAGVNYIEIICDTTGTLIGSLNTGFMNVDRIDLSWDGSATIEAVNDYAGEVFDVAASGAAVFEAEDASLFNAVGATGSTNVIGTEETKLTDGTVITNVKNFNTIGDKIVFQVNAAEAITGMIIDITAGNGATFGGTFADNDKILTVNGGTAITLTGTLTNSAFNWSTYGILTGTISLEEGINYIEISAASTSGAGYLNVDKVNLSGGSPDYSKVTDTDDSYPRVWGSSKGDTESFYWMGDVHFDGSTVTATLSEDGTTWTLDGEVGIMTEEQAKAFWVDDAKAAESVGDRYIAFGVTAGAGETVTMTTSSGQTYELSGATEDNALIHCWILDLDTTETDGWYMTVTITTTSTGSFGITTTTTLCEYKIVLGTVGTYCELNGGHVLTGTYDSATTSWTYVCDECGKTIDLVANTDKIASLTLTATDYASLSAAGKWSSEYIGEIVPLIDVTTDINMTGDVNLENCPKDMVLNGDITVTADMSLVIGTDVTLDLNGHTISVTGSTSYAPIYIGGESVYAGLTVEDNSADGTGKISSNYMAVEIYGKTNDQGNVSSFTLRSGTIEGSSYGIVTYSNTYSYDAVVINIEGGTVSGGTDGTGIQLQSGTLNVSGGTITGKYGVVVEGDINDGGKVTEFNMTGGTVEGTAMAISTNGQNNANGNSHNFGAEVINISGGTVKGGDAGIYLPNGTLTVTGGEISGKTGIEIKAGSATITGGTISTTVTNEEPSVTENSNGTSSSGYSIAIIKNSSYNSITSVSISGNVTLTGDIYSDVITDSEGNEVVTVADELGLTKVAYDSSNQVIEDENLGSADVDHYVYTAADADEGTGDGENTEPDDEEPDGNAGDTGNGNDQGNDGGDTGDDGGDTVDTSDDGNDGGDDGDDGGDTEPDDEEP